MSNKTTQKTNILEAASTLFASNGYSSVSMRDVAAAVGVTPANLYYHFKDKDELIRDSLSMVFLQHLQPLEGLLDEHDSPEKRLEILVVWMVRVLYTRKRYTRLIVRELLDGTDERIEYMTKTVFNKLHRMLKELISECAGSQDPLMNASSLMGLVLGRCIMSRVTPHLDGTGEHPMELDSITNNTLAILRATFLSDKDSRKV
jgi:AcrR family transcriptional regulator